MNSQNNKDDSNTGQGNIWGWKFSIFGFFLLAALFVVAFIIGEGPVTNQGQTFSEPEQDIALDSSVVSDTILMQHKDSFRVAKDSSVIEK